MVDGGCCGGGGGGEDRRSEKIQLPLLCTKQLLCNVAGHMKSKISFKVWGSEHLIATISSHVHAIIKLTFFL